MYFTVYQTVNKINHKIYIGKHQTLDLDDNYIGSGKLLGFAIKKYGLENFVKEILFVFDTEAKMNAKEAELVDEEFCLREDTYNICFGGNGGWGYYNSNSEIQRQKAQKSNKRQQILRKTDKEWVKKKSSNMSKTIKHQYRNKERKSHFSELNATLNKGKNRGKVWITNGEINKRVSNDVIPSGFYKGRTI